jgi:hypothetical protein
MGEGVRAHAELAQAEVKHHGHDHDDDRREKDEWRRLWHELRLQRALIERLLHCHAHISVSVLIDSENEMSNPASLTLGNKAQATNTATDSKGNTVANTVTIWSENSAGSVMTIDPGTGAIALIAVGTSTVTASVTDPVSGSIGTGTCLCTVSAAAGGGLTVTVDVV